ncbi:MULTISPECIES: BCD family MFS transporter [Rhodomicrobium]|uniref:BCD family MFS transporter n=1 Tax=Rhodomicrobium TaxID=1068 RepID=UPI0014836C39|nr:MULTISPECIES: BCD family MFS transporter [Rhodomicrobium]
MSATRTQLWTYWRALGPQLLPFADAATAELPLSRILRLSLFQVTVGMTMVLLTGTLNRVMILEVGMPAGLVALMVGLPLIFAPFRALIGFRSDHHRSFLGWRRVPYIWFGTLLQFGGLAIMPFALLVLTPDAHGPAWVGMIGAGLAFLLTGAGVHTTQTAGLALATDLAPANVRPRVVALLYMMLLVGMVASALVLGALLQDFSPKRLIQVIQGVALLTMVVNIVALWKQEPRDPSRTAFDEERPAFRDAWNEFTRGGRASRLLVAVGLGSAAFSMQDILLEPYGGEILHLTVGATTALTALLAGGSLAGFAYAARKLTQGFDPYRLAGYGAVIGITGFALITLAGPLETALLFRCGTALIGFGGGLFAVCSLTAAMALSQGGQSGLALGAWGAVQASSAGLAIALGGLIRDGVAALARSGALGEGLATPAAGYGVVYNIEIILLFATLIAIGPLVGSRQQSSSTYQRKFGLADMPS